MPLYTAKLIGILDNRIIRRSRARGTDASQTSALRHPPPRRLACAAAYANLVRLVHEKVGDDVTGFRASAAA
jgi:hypothetical protein